MICLYSILVPIHARITINGKQTQFNTKLEVLETNFFRKLNAHDLLIIDDFGMVKLGGRIQHDFEQIIDDRYNRKALILTGQLHVAGWYDVFQSELIAEACLDRIVHKAIKISLSGESLRKKY